MGGLKSLETLEIGQCRNIRDYSPIRDCTSLTTLTIDSPREVTDASWLGNLGKLKNIQLINFKISNFDFIRDYPARRYLSFQFKGGIEDCSALGERKGFEYLELDLYIKSLKDVLPILAKTDVKRMKIYSPSASEIGMLQFVSDELEIERGKFRDLAGLNASHISKLVLRECDQLTSLEGIQNLRKLEIGGMLQIEITGCYRLNDYTALGSPHLDTLCLKDLYSVPDLTGIRLDTLYLRSIHGLEDLKILEGLDPKYPIDLYLQDLGDITDLSPAYRLTGNIIQVPPAMLEQAEAMVANGNYEEAQVCPPGNVWWNEAYKLFLNDLEETETLPPLLLQKATDLTLAGDRVVNPETAVLREELDKNGQNVRYIYPYDSNEKIQVTTGSLANLERISKLTGLRRLEIVEQPLTSLEGMEGMTELEECRLADCTELKDVQILFTMEKVRNILLQNVPAESLQGIQNLTELEQLELFHTGITDLSPLTELPKLKIVRVSEEMQEAIKNLEEAEYTFEVEIIR